MADCFSVLNQFEEAEKLQLEQLQFEQQHEADKTVLSTGKCVCLGNDYCFMVSAVRAW